MLNAEQLNKIEEVLIAGCEKHLANGGVIVSGVFSNSSGGCCPIWSSIDQELLVSKNIKWPLNQAHWGFIQAVGFTMSEIAMSALMEGFDGLENKCGEEQMYALGKKLREKYIINRKEIFNGNQSNLE